MTRLTRARIGQPMIRGRAPRSPSSPCGETTLTSYGANRDPEFDQFASIGVPGNLTYSGNVPIFSTFTNAYPPSIDTTGWAREDLDTGFSDKWRLVNPGSGDYAMWFYFGLTAYNATGDLALVGTRACDSGSGAFASSVISGSGQVVTGQGEFVLQENLSTNTITGTITLRLYDNSWNLLATSTDSAAHVGTGTFGETIVTLSASLVSTQVGYALLTFSGTTSGGDGNIAVDSAYITVV